MSAKKKPTRKVVARRARKRLEKPIRAYGSWDVDPQVIKPRLPDTKSRYPEMCAMQTMHEGSITYLRFWNFWVRVGTPASPATDTFFHDYETGDPLVADLIAAVGAPTAWPPAS